MEEKRESTSERESLEGEKSERKEKRETLRVSRREISISRSVFSTFPFSFFSSLSLSPRFSLSPLRARASSFLSNESKRDVSNVCSPARPPRVPRAGGGPARRRRRPHRPPRPRGSQEGRGPPPRGTVVPIAKLLPGGKTGRLKLQRRRTRPANREEKKRAYLLLQLARRRPRPSSDVFCFCFSPLSHSALFICTHSLSVSQNRSRSGPRRPPRWPSSGSAARRGTPTS